LQIPKNRCRCATTNFSCGRSCYCFQHNCCISEFALNILAELLCIKLSNILAFLDRVRFWFSVTNVLSLLNWLTVSGTFGSCDKHTEGLIAIHIPCCQFAQAILPFNKLYVVSHICCIHYYLIIKW
jgi:hypothetical protein